MHIAERLFIAIRHSRYLSKSERLWDAVRPVYNKVMSLAGNSGLERIINGTDRLLVSPQVRGITEQYEPEVWQSLMSLVREGDVIADVGSHYGIYAITLAKRVGDLGRIIAFEPNTGNVQILRGHMALNGMKDRVQVIQAAVGAEKQRLAFLSNMSQSHVINKTVEISATAESYFVDCVTLDSIFTDQHVDLIKIDVEGYEEQVLRGGAALLSDTKRSPRAMYIEVHPYAWGDVDTTSDSLLELLAKYGYQVQSLNGETVTQIQHYGEIVAVKHKPPSRQQDVTQKFANR